MSVIDVLNFLYETKKFNNFRVEFITCFELGKAYSLEELYVNYKNEITNLTENADTFHTYFGDKCIQIWINDPKKDNYNFYNPHKAPHLYGVGTRQ